MRLAQACGLYTPRLLTRRKARRIRHVMTQNQQQLAEYFSGFGAPDRLGLDRPLAEEPHVARWRHYKRQAGRGEGLFRVLQSRLPQLCIPQKVGISSSPAYARVMRQGQPFEDKDFAGRLALDCSEALELTIPGHFAGALPVLQTPHREDFLRLIRAIGGRCEPKTYPEGMHAMCIGGINNWDRVRVLKDQWQQGEVEKVPGESWGAALKRFAQQQPGLIRDRVLVLHTAPYGSVDHSLVPGVSDPSGWLAASSTLRLEHEFTHYATTRFHGAMRSNMLDELIADCMGFVAALGAFSAQLFCRCMGMTSEGQAPEGSRARLYMEGFDDRAMEQILVTALKAASNLEQALELQAVRSAGPELFFALTALTLPAMASPEGVDLIEAELTGRGR
mgnify:FL=1